MAPALAGRGSRRVGGCRVVAAGGAVRERETYLQALGGAAVRGGILPDDGALRRRADDVDEIDLATEALECRDAARLVPLRHIRNGHVLAALRDVDVDLGVGLRLRAG